MVCESKNLISFFTSFRALNRESKEMKNAPDPEEGEINFAKYHKYKVVRIEIIIKLNDIPLFCRLCNI